MHGRQQLPVGKHEDQKHLVQAPPPQQVLSLDTALLAHSFPQCLSPGHNRAKPQNQEREAHRLSHFQAKTKIIFDIQFQNTIISFFKTLLSGPGWESWDTWLKCGMSLRSRSPPAKAHFEATSCSMEQRTVFAVSSNSFCLLLVSFAWNNERIHWGWGVA